ncbi:MAG: GNAT family N-acetyltransferase [Streptosporangiales bacterium]|nr:GNAT family N-acetyltransferase [Streptosporangiales bacterium]
MSEIIDLERAAALHWRGTEEDRLGGWLLRAAEGFTGRANSALPLGDPPGSLDEALAAVTRWYRTRGLPPMLQVAMPLEETSALDEALAARGWGLRPGPAFVMTADLAGGTAPPGDGVRVDAAPDDEWLSAQRYRGRADLPPVRMKVLVSAPEQAFVSIRDGGTAVAVARLSLGGGWAGITSVEVSPARRRRGLGRAITDACRAEAFARGARRMFLQVETANEAARALYEKSGFTYAHRYHYRLAPAGPAPG